MAKDWIDPRDVKPQTAGTLFLIGTPSMPRKTEEGDLREAPMYATVFIRVRVVMGQINVEDLVKVQAYAVKLLNNKVPFISFSAGRDFPYPEYQGDLDEFMGGLKQGLTDLKRPH